MVFLLKRAKRKKPPQKRSGGEGRMHQLRAGCRGSTAVHSQLFVVHCLVQRGVFLRQWRRFITWAIQDMHPTERESAQSRWSTTLPTYLRTWRSMGYASTKCRFRRQEAGLFCCQGQLASVQLDHDLQPITFLQSSSLRILERMARVYELVLLPNTYSGCMDGSVDPSIRSPMVRVTC